MTPSQYLGILQAQGTEQTEQDSGAAILERPGV